MTMYWDLTQDERYLQAMEFAKNHLNEDVSKRDSECVFEPKLWQKAADFGVLGWCMPKEYGGSGYDIPTTITMLEGIGYGCRDNSLTLGLNGQIWSVQEPLNTFGSESQKKQFLTKLCKGTITAAHAMTEKESGSNAFSLKTTGAVVDGGYLLNGEKCYVGMAPVADILLVFANTKPAVGSWGISAFIVETDSDGCVLSPAIEKMGLRSNPTGTVTLKDCFVPVENRLGPEGIGVSMFNQSMDWERGFIFASHVGAMAYQLDRCIEYAKNRRVFDQPIGKFQAVSHRIVEMKERLDTSRMMLYRVAELKRDGRSAVMESAMAKKHIAEAFTNNSLDTIRVHGALGYLTDQEVERDLRDAVGGVIYSGTTDIQNNIIANVLGL